MKKRYIVPLLMTMLLSSCSMPLIGNSNTGVEIGGVNYSDKGITYILSDPHDKAGGGAEPIDPFSAGGTMCCFSLPDKWQPGIKVRVKILDEYRKRIKDELIDILPYVDGKPGMLWVVYYQDRSIEVVSSAYGPPHEKWPGKIKGWPVPTIEYQRMLIERDINAAKNSITVSKRLLNDPKTSPDIREMAQSNLKYDTELLKKLEALKP